MAKTKSQRRRITMVVRYVVLTAWAIIAFFPIYWIISTSFKPDTQWFAWPPYYFPSPPTLANYMNVWLGAEEYAQTQYAISSQKPLISLYNSTIIATISTFLSVLFGSVLAYGVSRYRILSEVRMFQLLMLRMISADRRRGTAVALLHRGRLDRHAHRSHPGLLPHDATLRGLDDQKLHR